MLGDSYIRLELLKYKYNVDLLIRISILISSDWASPPSDLDQ